jgi:hypothetical protein
LSLSWEFFPWSDNITPENGLFFGMTFHRHKDTMLQTILTRIKHCKQQGVKVIIIPYTAFPHQNLLIYLVDDNKFIRFEPHGEKFRHPDIYSSEYYRILRNTNIYRENKKTGEIEPIRIFQQEQEIEKELEQFLDKYTKTGYIEKRIEKLKKLGNKTEEVKSLEEMKSKGIRNSTEYKKLKEKVNKKLKTFYDTHKDDFEALDRLSKDENKINLNKALNDALEQVFTKDIYNPKYDNQLPVGAKYESPDLYFEAEKGFQAMEGRQAFKHMTKEEYDKEVGGFCVLWSVFYLNVLLKFPKWSFKKINSYAYEYLMKKGEKGFLDLIVGYLQTMEKVVQKYVQEFDLSEFEQYPDGTYKRTPYFEDVISKIQHYITNFIEEEQKKIDQR